MNTPHGMMTAAGRLYHVPEEAVREYAGAVLDHVALQDLVHWAETWLDSPRTVSLWLLPLLLWMWPVGWAVGGTLVGYVGWALASPSFPSIRGARVMEGLRNAFVQGGYYAVGLSALAQAGHLRAVAVGLGAFVLFRWGVIDWGSRSVLRWCRRRLYPLPVTDQVLRGLIIRAALRYRVSVPQVDAMIEELLENWGKQAETNPDRSVTTPD